MQEEKKLQKLRFFIFREKQSGSMRRRQRVGSGFREFRLDPNGFEALIQVKQVLLKQDS